MINPPSVLNGMVDYFTLWRFSIHRCKVRDAEATFMDGEGTSGNGPSSVPTEETSVTPSSYTNETINSWINKSTMTIDIQPISSVPQAGPDEDCPTIESGSTLDELLNESNIE